MKHASPILLALLFLALAAPAQAAVTRSTVTSPADPTYRLHEVERTLDDTMLTVAAATDGAAGDEVDVLCTYGTDWELLGVEQNVLPGGKVEIPVDVGDFPVDLCDLRVVPSGYRGPDFSRFAGPAVAVSKHADELALVRGTERLERISYRVESGHQRAYTTVTAAGGLGLFTNGVKAGAHEPIDGETWRLSAAIHSLMVDGRRAYTSAAIPQFEFGTDQFWAPAGFEGMQSSIALDGATGALTVTESERIFRCEATDSERPREEDCRSVLDTGVRLERTVTLTREHSIADVRDRWISGDGQAHQVLAAYVVDRADAKATGRQWRFPADATFKTYAGGDVFPQGPGTVLVRNMADLHAPGALSFAPAPTRFTFDEGESLTEMLPLAVPAGGAAPVRRVFATARNDAEAAALGRATEDGFEPPRVVIASASAAGPEATVSGRATDNVGVAALTVAGRAVTVAADGSFSVPVALLRGANEITATATDGAGLSATARVTVQRSAVGRCRVPKVRTGARVKSARAAIRKAGCKPSTRRVRSRKVRKGRVVGLSRKAGTVVPLGTTVRIRVSRGR